MQGPAADRKATVHTAKPWCSGQISSQSLLPNPDDQVFVDLCCCCELALSPTGLEYYLGWIFIQGAMRLACLALLLVVGVVHVAAEYAGASSEPVKALEADAPSEQAKSEVEPLDGKAALVQARKVCYPHPVTSGPSIEVWIGQVAVERFAQAEEHKKAAEVELAQAKAARNSATKSMDVASLRVQRAEEKAAVMSVESRSTSQQASQVAAELAQLNALDQFKSSDSVAEETMAATQKTIDEAHAIQLSASEKADKTEADAEADVKAARKLAAEKVEAATENSKLRIEAARTDAETIARTAENKAEASEHQAAIKAQTGLKEEEAKDQERVQDTTQEIKAQETIELARSGKQVKLATQQEKADAQKELSEVHLLDAKQSVAQAKGNAK